MTQTESTMQTPLHDVDSSPSSKLPSAPFGHVVMTLVIIVLMLTSASGPLWHTDVWSHTKMGRRILDERRFPDDETMSPYTDKSQKILHYCWLGQVIFAVTETVGERLAGGSELRRIAGGAELLSALHQAAVVAFLVFLSAAYVRRTRSSFIAAIGFCLVGAIFYLTLYLQIQRPQTFGLVCLSVFLWMLAQPLTRRQAWIGLPLLMALWANLHASFALGLVLLAAATVGRIVDSLREGRTNPRDLFADVEIQRLVGAAALSIAASAILNPHGPKLFWLVATFGQHSALPTVQEWKPLIFVRAWGNHWLYVALLVVSIITLLANWRRMSMVHVLWLLVLFAAPIAQRRFLLWLIPTCGFVLVDTWAKLAHSANDKPWIIDRPHLRNLSALLMLALPALAFTIPGQWLRTGRPRPIDRVVHWATPWRLAAELKGDEENPMPLPTLRRELTARYPNGRLVGPIMCSETQGDYLLWALDGENPVLAFTQIHWFTGEYWQERLQATRGHGWKEFADKHRANLIAIEGRYPILVEALKKDPDWIVVLDETSDPRLDAFFSQHMIALRRVPK